MNTKNKANNFSKGQQSPWIIYRPHDECDIKTHTAKDVIAITNMGIWYNCKKCRSTFVSPQRIDIREA